MTLHLRATVTLDESVRITPEPRPRRARRDGGQIADSMILHFGHQFDLILSDRTVTQALYFALGDAMNWFDDQAGVEPSFNDQPPPVGARSWEDLQLPDL